jgi:hypothetical protein
MVNKRLQELLEGIVAKRRLSEQKLGSAAAEPVATSDAKAKEHNPEVSKDEVHAGEQAAEEVKAPLIEDEHQEVSPEIAEVAQEVEEGIADKGELDYEGDMASGQLRVIIDAAVELHNILDEKEDANLPEWVQSKLTLAKEYIDTVRDYMKSEGTEDALDAVKDAQEVEAFTKDEVQEVMEALKLDTHKYNFEYLAEAIGFKKLSKKSAAAKPVATSSKKAVEHTPVVSTKDVIKGQHAETLKAPLIEAAKGKKHLKVKVTPKQNVVLDNKGQLNQAEKSITPAAAVITTAKAGK